jgi:hypothetical protein
MFASFWVIIGPKQWTSAKLCHRELSKIYVPCNKVAKRCKIVNVLQNGSQIRTESEPFDHDAPG